jgi:hypothetical protein
VSKKGKKEISKTANLIQPPARRDVSYYLSVTMEKSGPADGSFDLEPDSYVIPIKTQINCLDRPSDALPLGLGIGFRRKSIRR